MLFFVFPIKQDPLAASPVEVAASSLIPAKDLETASDAPTSETLDLDESKKHLQQTLTSLEVKLKAADEEKHRMKKVSLQFHRNLL